MGVPTWEMLMAAGVGTAWTALTIDGVTGGAAVKSPVAGRKWNLPRIYLSNTTTATDTKVSVRITNGTVVVLVVNAKPVKVTTDPGFLLEQITLKPGWWVEIKSDTAASLDAFASVHEEDA